MASPEEKQDIVVVQADGTIDTRAAFDFEETLEQAFSKGPRCIVVDCRATKLLTSAGIRVLLGFAKRMKHKKGELVLMQPNEHVATVLDISGLGAVFPRVSSAEEAAFRVAPQVALSRISILTMRLLSGTSPESTPAQKPDATEPSELGSTIVGLLREGADEDVR